MAVKVPVRTVFDGSGNATGLAEFQTGEAVGYQNGGTGIVSLGTAGQILQVNANTDGLEWTAQGGINSISYTVANSVLTITSADGTTKTAIATDKMSVANTQALVNARLGSTASVTITGDVAGSASFSSNAVSIAVTQQNNSVDLGTHTTGNYVATISGTANEIEVSGSGSETAAVTIGLPNDVTVTGDLTVSGGDITLGGTGRIQGIDTVSAGTDAANKTYVDTAVANLVDSAPDALDTLNELAAALGDDANFATTVSTNIGQKLGATASVTLTGDVTGSGSFSANAVSFATSIASNVVGITELNVSDGTNGQYLQTDGAGTLSFSTVPTPTLASLGIDTTDDVQFSSLGIGTAASGTAGQIRATNSVVAFYSDARLKDFEGNIDNALDKVMQINGYYFTGNEIAGSLGYDTEVRQVGVSAQEIEKIMPEVIEDAPINSNIEGGADYKTVQYDRLVALLIEAIKDQQKQIEELKTKVG